MNKKGDMLVGIPDTIVWMVVSVIIFLTLWNVGTRVYNAAFSEDTIDKTSYDHFNTLVHVIESKNDDINYDGSIPYKLKKDLVIVAFSRNANFVPSTCFGLNIARPNQGCKGACLCICEINKKEQMCNSPDTICKDFSGILDNKGTLLDFNGDCNVLMANNKVSVAIVDVVDGKIKFNKLENLA